MFTCDVCLEEVKDEFMHEDEEGKFCLECGLSEDLLDIDVEPIESHLEEVWGINESDEPAINLEWFEGNLSYLTINTFQAVCNQFTTTKETMVLEEYLEDWSLASVEELAEKFGYKFEHINTYDGESLLDSCLQFTVLYKKDDWIWDEESLVVMSYHYGGDIRGNYSPYVVLEPAVEFNMFLDSLTRIEVLTDSYAFESIDAGYSWEPRAGEVDIEPSELISTIYKEDNKTYYKDEEVEFYSRAVSQ